MRSVDENRHCHLGRLQASGPSCSSKARRPGALAALAERRGRDLAAEGVSIVPIGGAHAIGRFLDLYGPQGLDLALAGLCDSAEEGDFQRGLERAGLGSNPARAEPNDWVSTCASRTWRTS